MNIRKILSVVVLITALVSPLFLQASVEEEYLICKGSGEECMKVDLGKGMTATFVKTRGSAAIEIKE